MDPRLLCCAAGICCLKAAAERARRQILTDLGVPSDAVASVSAKMEAKGIAFAPVAVINSISQWVDHPGKNPERDTTGLASIP